MENALGQTGYNTEMHRMARLTIMEVQTTQPYYPQKNIKVLLRKLGERPREEEIRGIYSRGYGTSVWSSKSM